MLLRSFYSYSPVEVYGKQQKHPYWHVDGLDAKSSTYYALRLFPVVNDFSNSLPVQPCRAVQLGIRTISRIRSYQ